MAPKVGNIQYHKVNDPNPNNIILILTGALQKSTPTAAGFKIVHIGTDKLPVSILE